MFLCHNTLENMFLIEKLNLNWNKQTNFNKLHDLNKPPRGRWKFNVSSKPDKIAWQCKTGMYFSFNLDWYIFYPAWYCPLWTGGGGKVCLTNKILSVKKVIFWKLLRSLYWIYYFINLFCLVQKTCNFVEFN